MNQSSCSLRHVADSDGMTLEALAAAWLEAMSGALDAETVCLYRLHLATHLVPHFGSAQNINRATIAEYGRQRLRVVKRTTLQKERSTLRGFLAWCEEQSYLPEPPEFPKLPRRATGTAFRTRRRGKATELSPEECEALIASLPQRSRPRGDVGSYPIRARFIVAHETALRPATLDALSVPEHYSRGLKQLVITDEIDKARFGRVLPLTDAARRALDSVARGPGLIFGAHDYRYPLTKAAKAVLSPHKARTFAGYDFRHARITELVEGGNLTGVAYLAGHKRVTTTSIYAHANLRAAISTLGAAAAPGAVPQEATARMVRSVNGSAATLRSLEPPTSVGQAIAEWQILRNALADERQKTERAAEAKPSPKRRNSSPRDPAALDDLVEKVLASGRFSAQLELRAHVGCSLGRLRASLERLTKARRVAKVRHPDCRDVWQVCGSAHGGHGAQPEPSASTARLRIHARHSASSNRGQSPR
jgi:integrase